MAVHLVCVYVVDDYSGRIRLRYHDISSCGQVLMYSISTNDSSKAKDSSLD